MSNSKESSGLGWRINLLLAAALLACFAFVAVIGRWMGLDPSGARLSFQYFCYTSVTAVVLWWGDIEAVLKRFPKLRGPALVGVIPAFFAVCLAISFGALAFSQAAVELTRRLLLPGIDPRAEWIFWPVQVLTLIIVSGIGMEIRHRLDPHPRKMKP